MRARTSSLRAAGAAALVALASTLPAAAGEGGLAHVVPAQARVFVGVDDVTALREGLRATSWAALLDDPAMSELREGLEQTGRNVVDTLVDRLDVDPFTLLEMVEGPAAFTVLDIDEPADAPGGRRGVFGVLLDCGARAEDFLHTWDALVALGEDEGSLLRGFEDVDGIGMDVVTVEENDLELRYGLADSIVLIVFGRTEAPVRERFLDLADGVLGYGPEPIADDPAFLDSSAADPDADLRVFADVAGFVSSIVEDPQADEQLVFVLDELLGLGDFGPFGMTLAFGDEGSWSHGELTFGEGLVADVAGEALSSGDHELLSLMPADVHQGWSLRLDPVGAFDAALGAFMRANPEGNEVVLEALTSFEAAFDFDLRDDIFASLGEQLAFCAYNPEVVDDPAAALDMAFLLSLEDGANVRTFLDSFLRSQGLHVGREREEFLGYELWQVPFPIGSGIAYAVLDDLLVLSLSDDLMRDVLRRKGGAGLPALGDREDVADALSRLGPEPTFVNVVDAAAEARQVITIVQAILSGSDATIDLPDESVDVIDPRLETAEIPPASVFREYFEHASATTFTIDRDGARFSALSR